MAVTLLCCLGSTLYTCHSVSLGLGRVYVRSALKSLSDAALGLFLLRVSQRLSVYMESEGSTPPALSPLWDLPHTLLLLAPLFLVPLCKKMGFFQGSSCLHYLTSTHLGLPLGRISGSKEETLGGGGSHTLLSPQGPPFPGLSWSPCPSAGHTAPEVGATLGSSLGEKKRKTTHERPTPKGHSQVLLPPLFPC